MNELRQSIDQHITIRMEKQIKMRVPTGFELDNAICNHGFFMMAPNCWMPSTKTFVRPLRLPDLSSVTVSISQPSPTSLLITLDDQICLSHNEVIKDQVKRMFRLSDANERQLKDFHRLHVDAARKGFGRIFRSPSLFEDLVKSLLLCNSKLVEENNHEELSVTEMTQLEEELNAALLQTRSRKTQLMMDYISTLQEKERNLIKQKEDIVQQIASAEDVYRAGDDEGGGPNDLSINQTDSPQHANAIVTLPLFHT